MKKKSQSFLQTDENSMESVENQVLVLRAELTEQIEQIKKDVPTWSELGEISKHPSQRTTQPNDVTIQQRGFFSIFFRLKNFESFLEV